MAASMGCTSDRSGALDGLKHTCHINLGKIIYVES